MAKPKFNLSAVPTFKAVVDIPVPGGKAEKVEFIFKHRTRDDFKKFIDKLEGREDVDVILDIASGWDLEDAFDADSLEELTQNYIGSARAIIEVYITELANSGQRTKN